MRCGAVAIGRNEGERLRRCLLSLSSVDTVVYVDSGSTDGSARLARELGCEVVELDPTSPFTAARARNAGFERLREIAPDIEHVLLVDGDCELVPGWLEIATERLSARPELAIVCGRRRERHPRASIYNRLCDVEWDTPIGDTNACGGDAVVRTAAFDAVGGFDASLIAGEEPELCLRLRRAGWKIERLDAEMTIHDAAMTRFSQWWRRARRSGHAYAEGAAMHDDYRAAETQRIWLWGAILPAVAIGAAVPTLGASLSLLSGYGVSAARAFRDARARGRPIDDAVPYALFTTLGKLPELAGMLEFHLERLRGQRRGLIEYK